MPRVLILEAIHESGVERLREAAEVELALGLSRAEQLRRAQTAEAVIIRSVTQIDKSFLEAAPRLAAVGRAGTGTDNIDLKGCAERGVEVITVPDGNSTSVAEYTILHMLAFCRNIYALRAAVQRGDFRRELYRGRELGALTVGIVGLGRIGQRVAQRLRPFGPRCLGYDTDENARRSAAAAGVDCVPLETLLRKSDIITMHVPRNTQTYGMIGEREMRLMKRGVFLINSSRGGIINETALVRAAQTGHVAGAVIDVLEDEPPFDQPPGAGGFDHPFLHEANIIVTPHCAASTADAQAAIATQLSDRVLAVLQRALAADTKNG